MQFPISQTLAAEHLPPGVGSPAPSQDPSNVGPSDLDLDCLRPSAVTVKTQANCGCPQIASRRRAACTWASNLASNWLEPAHRPQCQGVAVTDSGSIGPAVGSDSPSLQSERSPRSATGWIDSSRC
jgi:hypothetical protein